MRQHVLLEQKTRVTCCTSNDKMLYFGLQDGSIVESDINGNFSNYVAHSEPITCLSYGKYLYSCSHDGLIKYWDNGFLVRELQGHNGHITALVYTGTKLYSGGADKTINEWDPETGRRKWILTGSRGWIMCLASSPSLPSRLFSADTDHTIRIWDTSSGRCLHELKGHKDWIYSLCLNDQFLYSSSKDGTIRVWYCQDFSLISVLEGPDKQPITQVTVSSNKLFSCSENGSLYCWNLENQIPIVILGKEGNVSCLSSFGQWLVVGSLDGSIKLLDMGPSAPTPVTLSRQSSFDFQRNRLSSISSDRLSLSSEHTEKTRYRPNAELMEAKQEIQMLRRQLAQMKQVETELGIAKEMLVYYQQELQQTMDAHEQAVIYLASGAEKRLKDTQFELAHVQSLFDVDNSGLFYHPQKEKQEVPFRRVWDFDPDWDSDTDTPNELAWWRTPINRRGSFTHDPLVIDYFCPEDEEQTHAHHLLDTIADSVHVSSKDLRVFVNESESPKRQIDRRHSAMPSAPKSISKRTSASMRTHWSLPWQQPQEEDPETVVSTQARRVRVHSSEITELDLIPENKDDLTVVSEPVREAKLPKRYKQLMQQPSLVSSMSEWLLTPGWGKR